MRKSPVSKAEKLICSRLKQARERIGVTQDECARQIGIERATLVNYEIGRTPLRFDVALRFCRQMLVSEEWLATGKLDACKAAAIAHGIPTGEGYALMEEKIFFRQVMDLLSEPQALHIPPGTLYSEAYKKYLAPVYRELIAKNFYYPRLSLTHLDPPELAINLLNVITARNLLSLQNEAVRLGVMKSLAWRHYMHTMFLLSDLMYRKHLGGECTPNYLNQFAWLRDCLDDPKAGIGPLVEHIGPDDVLAEVK